MVYDPLILRVGGGGVEGREVVQAAQQVDAQGEVTEFGQPTLRNYFHELRPGLGLGLGLGSGLGLMHRGK